MKIYTRTGDKGQTSLASGERVSKSAPRVAAYGAVDELNSSIGWLRAELTANSLTELFISCDPILSQLQNELFQVGSLLASGKQTKLNAELISSLEREMDRMTEPLAPLKNFILPGGGVAAAAAHIARTACRRAEREAVALSERDFVPDEVIVLLNRMSDYFFVLARYCNFKQKIADVIWKS